MAYIRKLGISEQEKTPRYRIGIVKARGLRGQKRASRWSTKRTKGEGGEGDSLYGRLVGMIWKRS